MASVFRKTAIERISSPEQTDKMLRIAPPMGAIALITALFMALAFIAWAFFGAVCVSMDATGTVLSPVCAAVVSAPARGCITSLYVKEGAPVREGQALAEFSDGTQIYALYAHSSGTIGEISAPISQPLLPGEALLCITPDIAPERTVVCFLTPDDALRVQAGMRARIFCPASGVHASGEVLFVNADPASPSSLHALAGEARADAIGNSGLVTVALIALDEGFSFPRGASVSACIVLETVTPVSLAFAG